MPFVCLFISIFFLSLRHGYNYFIKKRRYFWVTIQRGQKFLQLTKAFTYESVQFGAWNIEFLANKFARRPHTVRQYKSSFTTAVLSFICVHTCDQLSSPPHLRPALLTTITAAGDHRPAALAAWHFGLQLYLRSQTVETSPKAHL